MNTFSFCKMHGLGNDFVIIDTLRRPMMAPSFSIPTLADRHCGIGFDQLLLLSASKAADVYCHIFNADGSEAEQCGNGMRCVARFAHEEKIIAKSTLTIETKAGIIHTEINYDETIRVNMGVPLIQKESILAMLETFPVELTILSLGNPHAICRVKTLKETPVTAWGMKIANNTAFPYGVNAGFMEVMDRHHIRLRTYERGAGETRACGSNACAAVIAGIINAQLDSPVTVECVGGVLRVEWGGNGQPVFLIGPAVRVFSGEMTL